MNWRRLHDWDIAPEAAERIQLRLAGQVREESGHPGPSDVKLVAGAAVSMTAAAVVVLETEKWTVVEAQRVALPADAPRTEYRRGLMAFAFGPAILAAFEKVESRADAVMLIAHGMAHPRRCGMATHLGLLLETLSVGCAETLLCGESTSPGPQRGDWVPVTDEGERIGACVRTREGSRPLYVSPGYKMDIEGAVKLALCATRGRRWPEPLRQARMVARSG
jgi:deoxyribonuclease V